MYRTIWDSSAMLHMQRYDIMTMKGENCMKKYKSLEELYFENHKLVFTYIGDYTTHQPSVQDIASIIWCKVADDPQKFLNMDEIWLRNYLRVMVRTAVSDYFKIEEKERMKAKKVREVLERGMLEEEDFLLKEELKYLEQAKQVLLKEDCDLILLRFEAGLSAREVGEAFGISEGAVRVRQHRILKKLKKEIIRLRSNEYGEV